jgi:hypothetical protein
VLLERSAFAAAPPKRRAAEVKSLPLACSSYSRSALGGKSLVHGRKAAQEVGLSYPQGHLLPEALPWPLLPA